jgi:peptidoglycan hydrolase CwlO-like protein
MLPLLPFGLTVVEISALGTFAAAIVGAIAVLVRLPGERGTLKITRDQGAATIYDNLVQTLQREVQRKDAEVQRRDDIIDARQKTIDQLRDELEELEDEIDGIRRRYGTRRSDGTEGPGDRVGRSGEVSDGEQP